MIYIEFKTDVPKGLIFLVGDLRNEDYISATLQEGRLSFERKCGKGRVFEIYSRYLADGKWHKVSDRKTYIIYRKLN